MKPITISPEIQQTPGAICSGGSYQQHSALHRTGDHAFDDVFLQEDEHDDRRQHGHHHGGHRVLPVGGVLSDEGVRGQGQRFGRRRAVDHKQREQEVVPDPHHVDDDDRGRDRLQQREDHAKEQPEAGGAVDCGAFVDFLRNPLYEAVVDEQGKRGAKTPIQNAQTPGAVG